MITKNIYIYHNYVQTCNITFLIYMKRQDFFPSTCIAYSKGRRLSLQERDLHTYTLKLG